MAVSVYNSTVIRTIHGKFTPTDFTISHIEISQQERYVSKLTLLNIVSQALLTLLIHTDAALSDLKYPDIYNFLLEFPSQFTGTSVKAY